MNALEAMRAIEDYPFSAVVNLASDLGTFVRILADQPEVQALSSAMAADPAVQSAVLQRVMELSQAPPEGDYEHPADAALAAYLWLLGSGDPELRGLAAEVVRQSRQTWWSGKMADRVAGSSSPRSATSRVSMTPAEVSAAFPVIRAANVKSTRFAVPAVVRVGSREPAPSPPASLGDVVLYQGRRACGDAFSFFFSTGKLRDATQAGEVKVLT